MSRAPPKRASATSPPRPAMVGTVLPQDSLRGLRGAAPPWATDASTTAAPAPLPPPPPSVASSAASSIAHAQNLRLLARAGRDLFRQGLAIDGLRAPRAEPRHPAVTPNLRSIPEDGAVRAAAAGAAPSELVVIVGGPLNARGEPGRWVASRIAKAIQLYWQTMLAFAREDEDEEEDEENEDANARGALCLLVPTGGEASDEGELETEAIRRALVGTGISPHHILMDCSATSLVDNALRLAGVLRRRRVRRVHVVTSAFHVARARLCFDEVLRAALGDDLGGAKLEFHGAPDGIKAADRAARHADEQARMRAARAEIDAALQTLRADAKSRTRHQHQQQQQPRRASSFTSDV